ncbi:thymidylate synthase [Mesoplasma florum L1]|uniref:Thymidylate synthase n=1 Tax=Mesoplasma florum (strain ATCC 33453 / NBRC 100688 / NCTC 11704 / L1) TaxID=265311 RepID=TYSY_MESFL|nr:thymidylate synthase [Mesoplasma florum]Q6F145.1 RecName: Full=Thymidylate synthase; Short=TS; Short=TSase [Mesoplasma florum L1]AAT75778.1 thymidylate synthase [Mesoplasma florum L1]AVN61092.1 thymidylate synthase [Mesoplasma florum]
MKQYLELVNEILKDGEKREDRTNTGTISKFGVQKRYDLREGFPLLTTKKVFYKAIFHEMLWFIKGDTNIKYLVENNVKIWNEWPYENFKKSSEFNNETLQEFVERLKNDNEFCNKWGDLGPVYGKQWRDFGGIDQFAKLINDIKKNPFSRRHIVSAWNPAEVDNMLLPPCHSFWQVYVSKDGWLDLQLYQRSGDVFLGVPFNIASYALLMELIAKECNLKARYFVHTIGDAHIYLNHLEQINEQLKRKPLPLCKIKINSEKSIFDIAFEDIEIEGYESHAKITGEVAV